MLFPIIVKAMMYYYNAISAINVYHVIDHPCRGCILVNIRQTLHVCADSLCMFIISLVYILSAMYVYDYFTAVS